MDSRSEKQFREFVQTRSRALRRTAFALTGDLHTAEDLVQGALIKLVRRWDKVDESEAYARRIIYHDLVGRWRRQRGVREDSVAADRRLEIQEALGLLAPRQRTVLVLRYYEDLPEQHIAAALGCSVGTVRSHTSRALARLRILAPELAGPAGVVTSPAEESA